MNTDKPLVTTVIPTYRRPHLLRRAIQSVLNQTYPHFQVCVYDNASGDETAAIVAEMAQKDARVKYHCHPNNIGMTANIKYALESVTTPFFSLLCDDDLLISTFYQTALKCFKDCPEAAFVSTSVITMDEHGILTNESPTLPPGFYSPPDGLIAIATYSKAPLTGTLYRREAVNEIGDYDQELSGASDFDFDLRIAAHLPLAVSAIPGAVLSVHESSASVKADYDFVWGDMLKIIQKLSDDENIPPESRTLASQILTQKLEQYMFQLGIVHTLRGNWNEARKVADIFRIHYHRHDKAFSLSALTSVSQHIPPIYQLLRMAQKARKSRHRKQVSQIYPSLQQDLAWINDEMYCAPLQVAN